MKRSVIPSILDPIALYCDNNGAIAQAKKLMWTPKKKKRKMDWLILGGKHEGTTNPRLIKKGVRIRTTNTQTQPITFKREYKCKEREKKWLFLSLKADNNPSYSSPPSCKETPFKSSCMPPPWMLQWEESWTMDGETKTKREEEFRESIGTTKEGEKNQDKKKEEKPLTFLKVCIKSCGKNKITSLFVTSRFRDKGRKKP